MVRLTAKDTLFGQPTFSSWLIEASGALPMKRSKDHGGEKVDNSQVMEVLMKANSSSASWRFILLTERDDLESREW